jgi:acyl carrier protein
MTNKEKYEKVFMDSFSIDENRLNEDLVYESVSEWDSVGHMGMIAGLEETFDILLETDDIIDFSSYTKGIEILAKYKVSI